jgi:hypothetical protein
VPRFSFEGQFTNNAAHGVLSRWRDVDLGTATTPSWCASSAAGNELARIERGLH